MEILALFTGIQMGKSSFIEGCIFQHAMFDLPVVSMQAIAILCANHEAHEL
jgi:hypothetical protein